MVLQAYVDDSGSEPQSTSFVLAGYVSTDGKWARFSDEWRDALGRPPGLQYFKASEAMSLRGQFAQRLGWTNEKRDERVIELSEIIWRHATVAVSAAMRHQDWADTFKRLSRFAQRETIAHTHPYVFLQYKLLSELWLHPTKLALGRGPCAFTFDSQMGFEQEATRFWRTMQKAIDVAATPSSVRNWMAGPPTFKSDLEILPLQAADLWAWSNRRALVRDPHEIKLPVAAVERLTKVPAMHLPIPREHLIAEARKLLTLLKAATAGSG